MCVAKLSKDQRANIRRRVGALVVRGGDSSKKIIREKKKKKKKRSKNREGGWKAPNATTPRMGGGLVGSTCSGHKGLTEMTHKSGAGGGGRGPGRSLELGVSVTPFGGGRNHQLSRVALFWVRVYYRKILIQDMWGVARKVLKWATKHSTK